jgi:hypothetical protein
MVIETYLERLLEIWVELMLRHKCWKARIPCSTQFLWSWQQFITHGYSHDQDWEIRSIFESRTIQREVFSPLYNCAPPDKEAIVVRVMVIPDFANLKLWTQAFCYNFGCFHSILERARICSRTMQGEFRLDTHKSQKKVCFLDLHLMCILGLVTCPYDVLLPNMGTHGEQQKLTKSKTKTHTHNTPPPPQKPNETGPLKCSPH